MAQSSKSLQTLTIWSRLYPAQTVPIRRDRNTLIDNGNTVAVADFVADGNEVLGMAINFGADAVSEGVEVIACAIE